MKALKEYAVVFTYNFDTDSEIYLFGNDYKRAQKFLKESFEGALTFLIDENKWEDGEDVESWHNDEWTCASITHRIGVDRHDCEYRLCSNVYKEE